ncbi:cysteine--tRNA ligase [Campylobacter insulaenigrae]|uniref:cysteine--tRNA ligase n=1 Tax=Campylobacter insulaenigrae TaxID=260714 RepID=UPI002152E0A4|nr:cysteine--tRNA ligase [Campylobacter insulaenigrae]MCR6572011.1 cysteine--tRNA ligase [Campylobacter insulaenigrae]MCR6573269.1 cysteine--tRNA ligase [Campylobacter insulaenigrae]MCR6576262.1 cysteine--tRNA ligase [Campylobacter insulaenigrae]MCR6580677.1 cysteine--tRNA ligase [Campylobacter insulaenigrae]MCR6581541.1 cysteine--tRNA ligase [Campylobacter insulaenigrae]
MVLFDSVLKKKCTFISREEKKVNLYLCGPTVYDDAHLGHARSSVCFDLLRRVLMANNYEVIFTRNYTDIDDKILKKMKEENQSLEYITNFYIKRYEDDMRALNILEPTHKPKATEYIQEMIEYIQILLDTNFAYKLNDGIYFDTSKDKKYFCISNRNLDDTQSRLEDNIIKKNPSDFVLWKFDDEFYTANFGNGRPGWHTECVVMIESIYKNKLDIHAGGMDLLFPHHENEACQCRCKNNYELANFWLHNGFVQINGEKMSKSLGNSFFLKDSLKIFCAEAIRFYLLSSHYRANFNYSLEDLKVAKKRLDKFYRLKKRLNLNAFKDKKPKIESQIAKEILTALNDDLNSSKALALLDEFINECNNKLDQNSKDKFYKNSLNEAIEEISFIFGIGKIDTIKYFQFGVNETQSRYIEEQIKLRDMAKKEKNYALADQIRDKLSQENIVLMDTANGVIWEKNG